MIFPLSRASQSEAYEVLPGSFLGVFGYIHLVTMRVTMCGKENLTPRAYCQALVGARPTVQVRISEKASACPFSDNVPSRGVEDFLREGGTIVDLGCILLNLDLRHGLHVIRPRSGDRVSVNREADP